MFCGIMAWKVIIEEPVNYSNIPLSFTTYEPNLVTSYPTISNIMRVTKEANLPALNLAEGLHYKFMLKPYSSADPTSPVQI